MAVALLIHLPSLGQPLLEAHSFRQTQTAFTALIFHDSGIDLFHSKLPILGAPWEVPFEFPVFQALASLVMDLGVPADVAMRSTALATFLVTAFVLWRLTVRLAGEAAGLFALGAFLFSPFALLWSRASLMEYLATAAAVSYVLFALYWHEGRGRRWYALALLAGALAMLMKITTGVIYVLPVAAMPLALARLRGQSLRSLTPYLIAMLFLVTIPTGLGVVWTMYADAIKSGSQFTSWLTSDALATWNFGTMAQKLSLPHWQTFVDSWSGLTYGAAIWIWTPIALLGAVACRRRLLALALVTSAWVGPALFTNLYFVHDYYLAAVTPLVAIGIGFAGGWLWNHRRSRPVPLLAAGLAALWAGQMLNSQSYWMVQYQGTFDVEDALVAARDIAANSQPDELVVVTGREWSPAALYYARRWGIMFIGTPDESLAAALAPQTVAHLRSLGYSKVFDCPWKQPAGCLRIIDLAHVPPDLASSGMATPQFIAGREIKLAGSCNMDSLNGQPWASNVPEVGGSPTVVIWGWALDGDSLARAIYLRLQDAQGSIYYYTTSPMDRPDVGAYLGDPSLSAAGYLAEFSPSALPKGEYQAMVVMDTEGGPVLCAAGRKLRV